MEDEKKRSKPVNNPVNNLEIPEAYRCPITLKVMRDPVTAVDGHTYERTAIEEWFRNSKLSPKTGLALDSLELKPNYALRESIDAFKTLQAKFTTQET